MPELANFRHVAGVHCSSSSIADILRYDGFPVSEAMAFGLGSGLGFVYIDDPAYSPVHRFNGRALDLEGKFYRLFGAPLAWAGTWQPQLLASSIAAGRPLLAQTDLAGLPYYERVHFPMHGIVVTGWDGEVATVADTFAPELQKVREVDLRAALVGEGCPLMEPYRIASVPRLALRIDAGVLARSIEVTAREMLRPAHSACGIPAMRRLAANGKAWGESADWSFSARFAYQGIEKRGTGGGGFRRMYADFLAEAAAHLPWIHELSAVDRLRASAVEWSKVAAHCKAAFVENAPSRLEAAAQALDKVADLEAEILEEMASAAARTPRFER